MKVLDNLFPAGQADRVPDLLKALNIESSPVARQWAVETFAAASAKSSDEILSQGLKVSDKIKDVYPNTYHYADIDTLKRFAIPEGNGSWLLNENRDGRYIATKKFDEMNEMRSGTQMPKAFDRTTQTWYDDANKGRFRCTIETVDIADDCSIPQSFTHSIDGAANTPNSWLEPITRDNPSRGTGDCAQFTQKKAVRVKVLDLKSGEEVTDLNRLNELLELFP